MTTKKELIAQAKELYKNGECYNTFELEEHIGSDLLVKDNIDVDEFINDLRGRRFSDSGDIIRLD